jgi:DNA-binding LytR/AlgR family response regulator
MYQAVRRGAELRTYQYLLWVAAEIICMALFYTFYERVILADERSITDLLRSSVLNTSLTLLLPYSVLWLYFSWREKKTRLSQLTDMPEASGQNPMIPLRDERGVLRLSLKRSDILYLQGSDNYVTVWYRSQNRIMKFMLRNTLRTMEDELLPESVIRCHRSFLVNMEHVKIIRREKEGLQLEIDSSPSVSVPVSRTYMQQVLAAFGQEG